jgi:hypothetical protein
VVFGKFFTDIIFRGWKGGFRSMKGTNRGKNQAIVPVIGLLALLLVLPSKAFGYVDPGSGSFIYQAIYAVFLGGVFYLRRLLDRIFKRNK